jgi:hypothetical protein
LSVYVDEHGERVAALHGVVLGVARGRLESDLRLREVRADELDERAIDLRAGTWQGKSVQDVERAFRGAVAREDARLQEAHLRR